MKAKLSQNDNKRRSGVLIHPISFPGKYGCGDLGSDAYQIIDLLKESNQSLLQILPLSPTGFGDSPYQSFSAFAGSPYLISFELLSKKGLLTSADLKDYPQFHPTRIDYGGLYQHNFRILKKAYHHFLEHKEFTQFNEFCQKNQYWLNDYALFMAIKDSKKGASWDLWEKPIRLRQDLEHLPLHIHEEANFYKFLQWEFSEQWTAFKKYANNNGIAIIGDAPIFVSYDSSDVWANQHLFYLDEEGKPEVVAGVPPDYFSETGQLWGNPLYNWEKMEHNQFDWWKKRIHHLLETVDCIRIDHFRGFEAYWEIKYGEPTAINGHWIKAPGELFFQTLKKEFGDHLKELVIAEDLGVITDEVRALRDHFDFPGMKIFQFAPYGQGTFEEDGQHLPNEKHMYRAENYCENSIAYPGTHDNDLLHGWFYSQSSSKQKEILEYLEIDQPQKLNMAIIKKIMESKSKWTIYSMQDILNLTSEARMNTPGTCGIHNWSWRLTNKLLNEKKEHFIQLKELTIQTKRG
ncbi:MAG: 4-alpha-glucanotransferase [Spirochaetes bacterium]|nr:4-alpha-glucanotransferase [Spirochaetota bacterium]